MMETKNIDESLGNDDLFGSFGEQDPFSAILILSVAMTMHCHY